MVVSEYKVLLVVFYMLPVFPWDSRSKFIFEIVVSFKSTGCYYVIVPNTATSFNTMGSDTRFYIFIYVGNLVIVVVSQS